MLKKLSGYRDDGSGPKPSPPPQKKSDPKDLCETRELVVEKPQDGKILPFTWGEGNL